MSTARNGLGEQSQRYMKERDSRIMQLEKDVALLKSQNTSAQVMRLSQAVGDGFIAVEPFKGAAVGSSGIGATFKPNFNYNRVALSVYARAEDTYSGSFSAYTGRVWVQVTEVSGEDGFTTISVPAYDEQWGYVPANATLTTTSLTAFFEINLDTISPTNLLRIDCSTDAFALGQWTGTSADINGMKLYYREAS